MPIFNAGSPARHSAINRFMEGRIKAPYVHSQVSTLGGVQSASIIVHVSLDPKPKWYNGIYQNSRYALWSLRRDGTLEQFRVSFQVDKKMRKQKATSLPDAVARINKYLSSVR